MIVYNDILQKLSAHGWSTYRLRKENILPNSVIDRIREGATVTTATLDTICKLLNCQPGDILSYVPNPEGKEK